MSNCSGSADGPLDVGRIVLARDVLLRPRIDAAPDSEYLPAAASNEIEATSSSRSSNDSKTTPKWSTKRRKTLSMRTRSDAAEAASNDISVIDLSSDGE